VDVTCIKCGTVAFAVTRAHAEAEVTKFNEYFDKMSEEDRASYGYRRSSVSKYEGCSFCKGTEFRPSKPDDCPVGCTLAPVIYEGT